LFKKNKSKGKNVNMGVVLKLIFTKWAGIGVIKNEKRWSPPLFTKQTTKITLRTLLFTKKPINPNKFKN